MTRYLKRLRPALVALLVLATMLAVPAVGAVAASNYGEREQQAARASIEREHLQFAAAMTRSLADGTPKELVDPLALQEAQVYGTPLPARSFMVDRLALTAAQQRAQTLTGLVRQLDAVETQVEVQLHQQLVDAVRAIRGDFKAAQDAGVDIAAFERFASEMEDQHQNLATPLATRALIDAVAKQQADLKKATQARVAANEALAAAEADARAALRAAQAALARAQAIPVLKLDSAAAAIADLAGRLKNASALSDFQDITDRLGTQAAALKTLLSTRQAAYDLLAVTRDHLAKARAGNIDVSQESPQLDIAAQNLDAATDLASVTTALKAIQVLKNGIDVKYNLAVYGPGKVIVISILKEELEALQDGVVVLDTQVTTGRPSLPSPVGTFSITEKYTPYHMVSPWPKGDKYWYPSVWIKWAMLWHDGGYFIHDAPWRYRYGPGSDTEYGGTHGCINVPNASMSWLYDWTPLGTKVVTASGDF